MKKPLLISSLCSALLLATPAMAASSSIQLQLPSIQTSKYQRPFVAVWIEKKGERKALTTISVWYDDKKWLKDIRRWWRKAGRYNQDIDGVTGATRAPGSHEIIWDGSNQQGEALPAGEYILYVEAVREHGNRTLLKQKISLGTGTAQQYEIDAGDEIGPVKIRIGE